MKAFSTLLILFIGGVLGGLSSALLLYNTELEAEKEDWEIKISKLESQLDIQLAEISSKVANKVDFLVTKKIEELTENKEQLGKQIEQFTKHMRDEIVTMIPLIIKASEIENFQLSAANMPEELEVFLNRVSVFDSNVVISNDEVAKARRKVSAAVNQLSALHRKSLVDQIALAEWSLNALDLLFTGGASQDLLPQLILAQGLSESVPLFVPPKLQRAVEGKAESLANAAKKELNRLSEAKPAPSLESLREGVLLGRFMAQSSAVFEKCIYITEFCGTLGECQDLSKHLR